MFSVAVGDCQNGRGISGKATVVQSLDFAKKDLRPKEMPSISHPAVGPEDFSLPRTLVTPF